MAAYVFDTERYLMMPDLIFRLNVKGGLDKIYLWKLINHPIFRERIQNLANGSAKSMSNISKERLQSLKIPVPPLALQQQFRPIRASRGRTESQDTAISGKSRNSVQITHAKLLLLKIRKIVRFSESAWQYGA